MAKRYKSLGARLEALTQEHVNGLDTPCRIWTGHSQRDGYKAKPENGAYGKINLWYKKDDEPRAKSRKFPVHWVAKVLDEVEELVVGFDSNNPEHMELFWDLFFAYRRLGLSIDHLCNHSLCTNPHHLEWVDIARNNGRKRWRNQYRALKMQKVRAGRDRHSRLIERHVGQIETFIRLILARRRPYNTKPSNPNLELDLD